MSPAAIAEERLVDAAEAVFLRDGWAASTIERIAAEAGVNRVTLHRRGVTKEGLFEALMLRATEDYRRRMWPVLTSTGRAADRLQAALRVLCETAEAHMALLTALQSRSDAVFHEEDGEDGVLTRTVFSEPLERILADGARDGSLAVADPAELATTLFNVVGWSYVHLRTGHGFPAGRAARAVVDLALLGAASRG